MKTWMWFMRIAWFAKTQDACWHLRAFTPKSHLGFLGHTCTEALLEQKFFCTHCGAQHQQAVQITHRGDVYRCSYCGVPLADGLDKWKQAVFETLDNCDVAIFQRITEPEQLEIMKTAKARGKFVIADSDDNYFDIPLSNPGREPYIKLRPTIEAILRTADALTVTTPALKKAYAQYNDNIHIVPNSYDVELFDVSPVLPEASLHGIYYNEENRRRETRQIPWRNLADARKGKKLICWAGSPTHQEDLEIIIKPLRKVLEKDEDVVLAMCCYTHNQVIATYPMDRFFIIGLVPVVYWFSMMQTLKPDVWLAPVTKHVFNASKSNLKKIESSLMGSMFVGSNFTTYNSDDLKGFLCEDDEYDWFTKIRHALRISDEEKLAINTHNREVVLRDFDIREVVKQWEEVFLSGTKK